MKAYAALLILSLAVLLAGCAQEQADIPPYQPEGAEQAVNAASQPNSTVVPKAPEPSGPTVTDQTPRDDNNIAPDNTVPPKPAQNQTKIIITAASCASYQGEQLLACVTQEAISGHDVTRCTQLDDKDLRYKCITHWCSSTGRDYHMCDKLRDYDDRMGCLNKCNPNANT
jgi:hypothetical protein